MICAGRIIPARMPESRATPEKQLPSEALPNETSLRPLYHKTDMKRTPGPLKPSRHCAPSSVYHWLSCQSRALGFNSCVALPPAPCSRPHAFPTREGPEKPSPAAKLSCVCRRVLICLARSCRFDTTLQAVPAIGCPAKAGRSVLAPRLCASCTA